MQTRRLRAPLVIAAIFSSIALDSAKGDTVTTVTRSTSSTTGDTSAIQTVPGSVVYFRTASPDVLTSTLELRRRDLLNKIDILTANGQINASSAEQMKRELQRIGLQTSTASLSYPVAAMLAEDLDLIAAQFGRTPANLPAYVPIIVGSTFTISTGQPLQLDDLSVRRVNLEARVTKALLEGRLTDAQAANLRNQLSGIGAEAASYTADGNMNFKESSRLYTEFDRVASQLERHAGKENN
jgi:hypothetical protein